MYGYSHRPIIIILRCVSTDKLKMRGIYRVFAFGDGTVTLMYTQCAIEEAEQILVVRLRRPMHAALILCECVASVRKMSKFKENYAWRSNGGF
jgi:hypothetical protein